MTGIDTPAELARLPRDYSEGILTDEIEILAPARREPGTMTDRFRGRHLVRAHAGARRGPLCEAPAADCTGAATFPDWQPFTKSSCTGREHIRKLVASGDDGPATVARSSSRT